MILFVTGSRALNPTFGGTEASERWARNVLDSEIRQLPSGAAQLFTGGAVGPDTWAREELLRSHRAIDWLEWLPNGETRSLSASINKSYVGAAERWTAGKPGPLARNRAMVERLAKFRNRRILVVGLIAPWSRTHGTEYTLRLAREAGLDRGGNAIFDHVCPTDFAPAARGRRRA